MNSEPMTPPTNGSPRVWSHAFYTVLWAPSTYLKILYLLLALPLGVVYFGFLVTGFALGIGLTIVWIGLPILLLMILSVYALTGFERLLGIHLLDQRVLPLREPLEEESAWLWLKSILTSSATWKGLVFLLLKFPLGIFSFVVTVVLSTFSLALLLAPILLLTGGTIDFGFWFVDTLPEAFVCTVIGAVMLILTLHLLNALGWVWGQLARLLLGKGVA